jgi:probable addiction module antidote protein
LLSVTFHFSAPEGPADVPFPGAAWRGAFGYALKRTVCIMRPRVCPGCPFERSCAYPYIFETAPGDQSSILRQADRTPRPVGSRLSAHVEYLKAAMEGLDDPEDHGACLLALRTVAEAYGGLGVVAAEAGISREALYRALSPKGAPTLKTLLAVLKTIGMRLSVEPSPQPAA